MGRVEGKVALITGAARGQGAAHARALAAEGATVVVTDVLDDLGRDVAAGLGAAYLHLDVRREQDWAAAAEHVSVTHGRLDVLVNNAGVLHIGPIETTPLEEYLDVIAVNQVGCWLGMRAFIPLLRASGRASIINVSSTAGITGMAAISAYTASKFAVRGMTKCAAIELGPDGIRVNSVHPGTVRTAMTAGPGDLDESCSALPVPRAAEPEEISPAVVFLASDESAFCTGGEFVIDGGMLAGPPANQWDDELAGLVD